MVYKRSTSLTPMALRAINFHMRGYSKREAMRMAGYSPKSIDGNYEHFWGSKSVKAEVKERMRKLAVKTDITLDRLVGWLRELLDADPADLVDDEGNLKPPKDIAPELKRWLNWKIVRGQVVYESIDKLRIIELIAKLTGLAQETINVRAEGDLATKIIAARKRAQIALPAPKVVDLDGQVYDAEYEEEEA